MIKSVPHLTGEIMRIAEQHQPWSEIDKLIKEYAESIIDECASNFECTLEQRDIEQEDAAYTLENGDQVYPVLVRSTIFDVKKQL